MPTMKLSTVCLPRATLLLLVTYTFYATASPAPLHITHGDAAADIHRRQSNGILNGTCTVSTNLCLATLSSSTASTSLNFTCGNDVSFLGLTVHPSQFCTVDGHACKVLFAPLGGRVNADCSCKADNSC
ncbi:hypothetical protein V8F20_011638 [Naviculisporaceae sp. PSN 640]